MTKHRRTKRRSQKGGFWPFSSSPADPNAPTQSWGDYFSSWGDKAKGVGNSLNNSIGNVASSAATSITDGANSLNPFASNESSTTPVIQPAPVVQASPSSQNMGQPIMNNNINSTGGRHRKRARSMKGGKGGSNLAYYAAPVSGLKVAEPTTLQYYANGVNQYSVKGGSRRRKTRKSRRTRRHRRR
jgi:hypothetical protein